MLIGITGGAGFIGTRLGRALLDAGHQVAVIDNLHPQVHPVQVRPADLDDRASLLVGDVTLPADWDTWFATVGQPDVIVHLAAETGTGQSLSEASRHGRVNVVGTTELVDALTRADHRPRRIALASSRAVYGEGRWQAADGSTFYPGLRSDEQLEAGRWDPEAPDGTTGIPLPHRCSSVEPRPANIYAATKLAQEHVLGAWCGAHGVPLTTLRLQNVYGPGQAVGNPYTGVLTFFARQLTEGRQLDVYEDGRIVRDFVFVDDVVDAFVKAIGLTEPTSHRLDIGSGRPSSLAEVAATMTAIVGGEEPVISGRFRAGDVRSAWADVDDARAALGWQPRTDTEAGLRLLLEWVGRQMEA